MRGILVAIGVFAVVAGGCGSSSRRTATAGGSAQLASGSCSSESSAGSRVTQSCVMVLSDGRRFRCSTAVAESRPSVAVLEHTKGCGRISPLDLSTGVRAVIEAIGRTRTCLAEDGLHALGGPVLPLNRAGSSSPDGELVISHAGAPTFIAFYTDPAKATRLEPAVARNANPYRTHVERRGAVTILWSHPSASERRQVQACATS